MQPAGVSYVSSLQCAPAATVQILPSHFPRISTLRMTLELESIKGCTRGNPVTVLTSGEVQVQVYIAKPTRYYDGSCLGEVQGYGVSRIAKGLIQYLCQNVILACVGDCDIDLR